MLKLEDGLSIFVDEVGQLVEVPQGRFLLVELLVGGNEDSVVHRVSNYTNKGRQSNLSSENI